MNHLKGVKFAKQNRGMSILASAMMRLREWVGPDDMVGGARRHKGGRRIGGNSSHEP